MFPEMPHAPAALAAFIVITSSASAAPPATFIRWAEGSAGSSSTAPGHELFAPDRRFTTISDYHHVWVRDFGDPVAVPDLAALLDVDDALLAKADVIAFEGQGGAPAPGGGWESSTWFFSDLSRSYAETFDETAARGTIVGGRRARFATGSLSSADYARAFCARGGCASPPDAVMSWILIDVPDDIAVKSPDFSIWVSGALRGEGTPDPDAIGLLVH